MNTFRRMDFGRRLAGVTMAVMLLVGLVGPSLVAADGGNPLTGTAVIANADGQNVKLREAPSRDAAELDRFAEGTEVEIVDGPVAGDDATWYQVEVDDLVGFMDADFLEEVTSTPTVTPTSTPGTPVGPVSGQATVTENLHVRSGPSTADSIVVTLQAGAVVTLTGGERNGFVSVSAAGGDGWVAREFLVPVGTTPVPTPPAPTSTPVDSVRFVLENVHLRSGAGESFESLGTLPVGTQLTLLGDVDGLFARVSSPLGEGWVYTQVIGPVNPNPTATVTPTATPTGTTTPTSTATPGQTGTRYTLVVTNLRSGASTDASSIVLMDSGVPVELQGAEENGFAQVSTVFGDGWVALSDIGDVAPGTTPTVTPSETATPVTPTVTPVTPAVTPTSTPAESGPRWTTENVNLRSAADTGSASLGVIAAGTEVRFMGQTSNGLSEVETELGTGWIVVDYLTDTEPVATPTPTAPPSSARLSWPISGGEWRVLQGYNGSSHQNNSSTWQYLYSLDLVRTDGSTVGQPVYAPADGTVRWIDEAFGGGSIYLGNGLAFAWFHTIVDPAVVEGGTVTKGQLIGTIAPAGVAGGGSTPHLHITMWQTDDEGNWSRRAIPFTGELSLEGTNFPSDGSPYQWTGTVIVP